MEFLLSVSQGIFSGVCNLAFKARLHPDFKAAAASMTDQVKERKDLNISGSVKPPLFFDFALLSAIRTKFFHVNISLFSASCHTLFRIYFSVIIISDEIEPGKIMLNFQKKHHL